MKYIHTFLLVLAGTTLGLAQNNVGIGTATPHISAILDIQSNNKGLLVPRLSPADRVAITSPANGLLVYDTVFTAFMFHNGVKWLSLSEPYQLIDQDGDTHIKFFESFNDAVELTIDGSSVWSFDGVRITPPGIAANTVVGAGAGIGLTGTNNTLFGHQTANDTLTGFNNVFVGSRAGKSTTSGYSNVFLGADAGYSNTTGIFNMFIGHSAGASTTAGTSNLFIGESSGIANTTGSANLFLGYRSGWRHQTGFGNIFIGNEAGQEVKNGHLSTYLGHEAGKADTVGLRNTYIGARAGADVHDSMNVFIGYEAGRYVSGGNKLAIENSASISPLIYGEFDNDLVRINGTLQIGTQYSFPLLDGVAGQTLLTNGTGLLAWGAPALMHDNDSDTRINVEETLDEDKIRFDLGGIEHFVMNGAHLAVVNSGGSVFIGENAGILDDLTNNYNTFIGAGAGTSNTSGFGNTFIGESAGAGNSIGERNTFVGRLAGQAHTTGTDNTLLGHGAGFTMSTGLSNTLVGSYAGAFLTTGSGNILIGASAGGSLAGASENVIIGNAAGAFTTSSSNTFVGFASGNATTTGGQNTAVGRLSQYYQTTGSQNTALGNLAALQNSDGHRNVAIGYAALEKDTTGSGNVAVGAHALASANHRDGNVAVGDSALYQNGTGAALASNQGAFNTAVGKNSLRSNTSGYANTALGYDVLAANVTGVENIGIGLQALGKNTSGIQNVCIGNAAMYANALGSFNSALGYGTLTNVEGSNNVAIGYSAGLTFSPVNVSHSVFIGSHAGGDFPQSNRLYIESLGAPHPLIYGEFDNDLVEINGKFGVDTTTAHQFTVLSSAVHNTRLIGPTSSFGYGARLNFGDQDYVYIEEPADDLMRIQANLVGIRRTPTANNLELDGTASKTTAGDWLANSDLRIKTDIQDIENSFAIMQSLRPVKFRYTKEWMQRNPSIKEQYYYNFIAQEYRDVFPESVQGSGEMLAGEEVLQIDTYNAQIVTIQAVKDLIDENKELRERLDRLEKQVSMLTSALADR
ncbi:MAG: tail fiber domain-containing protein [Saprospiraceae bacterium]|nr:tail fiber domain-containing protein [Saprospiraceae bacterium]